MAIKAFEDIQRAAQGAGAGAVAAQQQLSRATSAMSKLLVGGAITAGGVFGLDIIKGWVEASSEMSTELAKLATTTHATRAEMDALETSFTNLTRTSTLSTGQIAGVAQAAAGAGLTNAKALVASLPALVQFADVLQKTRGVSPDVSVPAAVKMENLFGIQPGSARYKAVLNAIAEASKISGSPQALLGQLRQAGPSLVNMGIPPEQVIPMLALQAQLGLGASGGARGGLAAILRGIIPAVEFAGAKERIPTAAQKELGIPSLFDAKGQFAGIVPMLSLFARDVQKIDNPLQAQALFAGALGKQGGQLAMLLSNPSVTKQLLQVQQQVGTGSIAADQKALMQTPGAQWTVLKDTLQSIAEILGDVLLPGVLKVITAFAQAAGVVASFLQSHKDIASLVATFTAVATAAALIAGPIIMAAGAFDLLAIAGGTLGLSMAAFTPFILPIAAAIGAVLLIATHWHDITTALDPALTNLGRALKPLSDELGRVGHALAPVVASFAGVHGEAFTNLLTVLGRVLGPVGQALGALSDQWSQWVAMLGGTSTWLDKTTTFLNDLMTKAVKAIVPFTALKDMFRAIGDALQWAVTNLSNLANAIPSLLAKIPGMQQILKALGLSPPSDTGTGTGTGTGAGTGTAASHKTAPLRLPPYVAPHPPIGKGGGGPLGSLVPLQVPTMVPHVATLAAMTPAHLVAAHAALSAQKVARAATSVAHPMPLVGHAPTPRPSGPGHPAAMTVHVGGITVHGAPHESPEAFARRMQASVEAGIAKALAHHTRYDGAGHGGLEPASWGY